MGIVLRRGAGAAVPFADHQLDVLEVRTLPEPLSGACDLARIVGRRLIVGVPGEKLQRDVTADTGVQESLEPLLVESGRRGSADLSSGVHRLYSARERRIEA